MLRSGFIGTLSDYVASRVDSDKYTFDKAQETFGLRKHLADSTDPGKFIGLFSEWLVFDHRQKIFDGSTGLEYFVKHNPLGLPASEHSAYKDMLDFEVGLFEVKSVEQARGVTLESIANGATHFVHDINTSLSLRPGETIWTRIASIEGLYHMVGSSSLSMPIKIMGGMRDIISTWRKNSFDAREAASWFSQGAHSPEELSLLAHTVTDGVQGQTYEQIEKNFTEALKKCGMDKFFSVETYKKWTTNERKYPLGFATRAIMALIPPSAKDKDVDVLIEASMHFANSIPRKSLKGKTPNEANADRTEDNERVFEMDVFSREKYADAADYAGVLMRGGKFKESYKAFEVLAKEMREDKVPLFDSFRMYANAAVCCLGQGDIGLGEELLNAALRINPLYDFAVRSRERYVAPYDANIEAITKKSDKKFAIGLRGVVREDGVRRYKRSAFRRYEVFLKDMGVSLEYQTSTTPSAFIIGKDGAKNIGRNDICYCGSEKKFKKCCGK